MKSAMCVMLCLAISSFICTRSLAASKVIIDPNANGVITAKLYAQTDPSLNQKVTYEARFCSVDQILDDLSQKTGVKLIAGVRDSDWPVRSRKMNIFVKDVPLSDLMDSISRTMKFRWSRYDNVNPLIYRLKVDGKAAQESDAMMRLAEEKKEAIWQKRRTEWIDAIMKYGSMADSEVESLRDDPVIYRYARYGAIRALRALFVEVPEAKDRFAEGRSFRIAADELSSETRELVYSAGNEYWRYLQKSGHFGKPMVDPPGYGDMLKSDDPFDIAFYRMDETAGFTPGLRWGGSTQLSSGYFHLMVGGADKEVADLRAMNEDWSKCLCEWNNQLLDGQPFIDNNGRARYEKLVENLKNEDESLYPSEPLIDHKAFPEMENKVKLVIEPAKPDENPVLSTNNHIASFQKALFDATGIGIVSDSWVNIKGEKLPDQEGKLGDVLDKFSKSFNYNWDKQSSILELRHRKWAKMRLNQIPDEWIATWDQNTRDNGFLRLEDLAAIANLTYYQAEESIKPDKMLGASGMYPQMLSILDQNGSVIWLRLYSSLTSQQRKLLESTYGLNGHMLTSPQWKIAQRMFDRLGITRGEAIMRLVYTVDKASNSSNATFTELDSCEVDRIWDTYLPGYDPGWEKSNTK